MCNNTRFDGNHLIENRQIRIFLSSTFSDMKEERRELIRRFDRLKIEANRRNVYLSVVDLRWGVTEDDSQSGKVLSVCLNEIEHSHPFFVGLLGSRYGFTPEMSEIEKNPDLKERYPWIEKDISDGLSITEIEMQYGALRNAIDVDAAFYIKKCDVPDDNPKLSALKEKIREQKRYSVGEYSTVEELCSLVESEIHRILDRHFPERDITPLERERTAQRAYINSWHANYFKRQSYFDVIDAFVHSNEQHLVITGESGMGKSALLANWVKENEYNDDFNLVCHFVGNSFSDNNYENVLRHLCDEIYDLYSIDRKPTCDESIEDEAQNLINKLAVQNKQLVIVIDGINQIAAKSNEKLLLWLPDANGNVKYIFSSLYGDETMCVFEQRCYQIESITPLSSMERERFVVDYLGCVGKHLNENQLRLIVNDPENRNTLVLKSLLDELICFGSYERLDSRIDYYLSASSTSVFFDRVIMRMEDDYSANLDLVKHALTLIAVSERGLSEDELVAILGCRQFDWNLFFCAFYNHFIVKEGLITFSHQFIASAVENRYHTDDASQMAPFRQEIASYFVLLQNKSEPIVNRRISELAHQYYHLSNWKGLYKILLNFDAFNYFNGLNKSLFGLYWRSLINCGKKFSLSAYMKLAAKDDSPAIASFYYNIAFFIQDYITDYKMALKYYFKALKIQNKELGESNPDTANTYNNIGYVYQITCRFDKALAYYGTALKTRENVYGEKHHCVAESYNNIGSVLDSTGEYTKALENYDKAIWIFESLSFENYPDLSAVYNNIALVYCSMGDYKKSEEYFDKATKIDVKMFGEEHPNTAADYDNNCSVYDSCGDFCKSLEFHKKALRIREKLFGEEHPDTASSYNCLGCVYESLGDFKKAIDYFKKALVVREKVFGSENIETATCYNNIGSVFDDIGEHKMALEYYFKSLRVYRKIVGINHADTATCYNNIGNTYFNLEDYDNALLFFTKALKIRMAFWKQRHHEIAESYDNLAMVFLKKGDLDKALVYCDKAQEILEEVLGENNLEIATCYNNKGAVYSGLDDCDQSILYYCKALKIRERLLGSEHIATATCNNNLGFEYSKKGDYEKALFCFRKVLEVYMKVMGIDHPETVAVQENIKKVKEIM